MLLLLTWVLGQGLLTNELLSQCEYSAPIAIKMRLTSMGLFLTHHKTDTELRFPAQTDLANQAGYWPVIQLPERSTAVQRKD